MEGVRFAVLGWVGEVTSECHEWTIPTYSTYPCLRIKQKPAYQGLLGHQMHNTLNEKQRSARLLATPSLT